MNNQPLRRWAGVILILTPLLTMVFFTLLQMSFDYPDILRAPTDTILRQFQAGGSALIAMHRQGDAAENTAGRIPGGGAGKCGDSRIFRPRMGRHATLVKVTTASRPLCQ